MKIAIFLKKLSFLAIVILLLLSSNYLTIVTWGEMESYCMEMANYFNLHSDFFFPLLFVLFIFWLTLRHTLHCNTHDDNTKEMARIKSNHDKQIGKLDASIKGLETANFELSLQMSDMEKDLKTNSILLTSSMKNVIYRAESLLEKHQNNYLHINKKFCKSILVMSKDISDDLRKLSVSFINLF